MIFISQPRAGHLYNESLALQMAARHLGWDTHGAHFGWRLPDEIISSNDVGVPYGSQTFCEVISQQMNWELIANPHDWLAKLPREYLKRDVRFYLLGDVRHIKFNKPMFIKPADYKLFPAKVYEPGEFNPPASDVAPDDTPVLVSEPVEFIEEYRAFVSPTHCKTISCYLFRGEINEQKYWDNPNCDNAKAFVECALSVAQMINSPATYSVIDVGLIRDNGWAVIESNQAWASGIYGCDPCGVLDVLKNTCRRLK